MLRKYIDSFQILDCILAFVTSAACNDSNASTFYLSPLWNDVFTYTIFSTYLLVRWTTFQVFQTWNFSPKFLKLSFRLTDMLLSWNKRKNIWSKFSNVFFQYLNGWNEKGQDSGIWDTQRIITTVPGSALGTKEKVWDNESSR